MCFYFFMLRRSTRSIRTDTPVPYTTRVRSARPGEGARPDFQAVRKKAERPPSAPAPQFQRRLRAAGTLGDFRPASGLGRQRHRLRLGLGRSEEHTSELQSLMRISYAVFCLKKQKDNIMYKPIVTSLNN